MTTRPQLSIRGDLNLSSEGVSATLTGDGERLVLTVHEATSPRDSRMWLSAAANGLRIAGNQLTINDADGRVLATAGSGVRSPLGRMLIGSVAVRPRIRNILRQRRTQMKRRRVRPND